MSVEKISVLILTGNVQVTVLDINESMLEVGKQRALAKNFNKDSKN